MSVYYLAMYGDKVSILDSIFISIFAMIVVFLVLLIISYMIDGTAFFVKKIDNKNIIVKSNKDIVLECKKKNNNVINDSSVDVAVIAAAVAMYMNTSVDNIRIRKIRRI